MKKANLIAAAAAFLMAGSMTSPALADCKSEIATVRGLTGGLSSGHGGAQNVEKMLERAEQALAAGKKKKGNNIVKKAKDKASSY